MPLTHDLSTQISQYIKETKRFVPTAAGMAEDDDESLNGDIDSPAPEDYIVNVGELEGDDQEDAGTEDDGQLPSWAILEERLEKVRAEYRRGDMDTGSPEYQVAGMTERIAFLTQHLKEHPKDFSTRRGLVALVNKRRRLLNYLVREDIERYKSLVASLGIRHKAPGRVELREDKYSRYPNQKAIKKHLVKKR